MGADASEWRRPTNRHRERDVSETIEQMLAKTTIEDYAQIFDKAAEFSAFDTGMSPLNLHPTTWRRLAKVLRSAPPECS